MPFHQRKERWACLVAHRRAGKTVAAVNDIIWRACQKVAPYAYIAPYRMQAKQVAWDYFKFYGRELMNAPNEAELKIPLKNGSTIHLFGADNADAMRGLGFGGVYCDEYGDFRPSVWGNVIRPTLSDRRGWAVFGGTPKGHNQFYDIHRIATSDAEWFSLVLKASTSKLLHPEELRAAKTQLSHDQYDQEYECSFDAAILGAYYGREMALVDAGGRIRSVPHDPAFPVNTAWDLGRLDDTAIWWYQNIGNEIHVLDYFAESGGSIEEFSEDDFRPGSITQEVIRRARERGYQYERHWLPHDAKAKTLQANGKSIIEQLANYLGIKTLSIVPNLSREDGIQAARSVLGRCYFDNKCNADSTGGIECLRQYQRAYDEDKKAFSKEHLHNWASHGADAFRMLAVAERKVIAAAIKPKPVIQNFDTLTLDQLWEWADERAALDRKI